MLGLLVVFKFAVKVLLRSCDGVVYVLSLCVETDHLRDDYVTSISEYVNFLAFDAKTLTIAAFAALLYGGFGLKEQLGAEY